MFLKECKYRNNNWDPPRIDKTGHIWDKLMSKAGHQKAHEEEQYKTKLTPVVIKSAFKFGPNSKIQQWLFLWDVDLYPKLTDLGQVFSHQTLNNVIFKIFRDLLRQVLT